MDEETSTIFIQKEKLNKIDFRQDFFESLRKDYYGFNKWFIEKSNSGKSAYITKFKDNIITSFLMLKQEDENENYSDFEKIFSPGKRLKISTFKVEETGKNIGNYFIEIAVNEAIKSGINEIYITTFSKQKKLINFLEKNGFEFFTYKNTMKSNMKLAKELVYVKKLEYKAKDDNNV